MIIIEVSCKEKAFQFGLEDRKRRRQQFKETWALRGWSHALAGCYFEVSTRL